MINISVFRHVPTEVVVTVFCVDVYLDAVGDFVKWDAPHMQSVDDYLTNLLVIRQCEVRIGKIMLR